MRWLLLAGAAHLLGATGIAGRGLLDLLQQLAQSHEPRSVWRRVWLRLKQNRAALCRRHAS